MHLAKRELAEAAIFYITFARLAIGFLQVGSSGKSGLITSQIVSTEGKRQHSDSLFTVPYGYLIL